MGVKFDTEEGLKVPSSVPNFTPITPMGTTCRPCVAKKPQNRPLCKLNTGRLALRAMLPVITKLRGTPLCNNDSSFQCELTKFDTVYRIDTPHLVIWFAKICHGYNCVRETNCSSKFDTNPRTKSSMGKWVTIIWQCLYLFYPKYAFTSHPLNNCGEWWLKIRQKQNLV